MSTNHQYHHLRAASLCTTCREPSGEFAECEPCREHRRSRANHRPKGQKVSLTLAMASEIAEEARRLDRPVSWVVRQAWKVARAEIRKIEGAK